MWTPIESSLDTGLQFWASSLLGTIRWRVCLYLNLIGRPFPICKVASPLHGPMLWSPTSFPPEEEGGRGHVHAFYWEQTSFQWDCEGQPYDSFSHLQPLPYQGHTQPEEGPKWSLRRSKRRFKMVCSHLAAVWLWAGSITLWDSVSMAIK